MNNDAILVLKSLFQTIWRIFTAWNIPGTNVSPAAMFFFLGAAGIGLNLVTKFLGGGVSGGATAYFGVGIAKAKADRRAQDE